MDVKELQKKYKTKKRSIKEKLEEFRNLPERDYEKEFMFCILTPQSNAQRCWEAVEQLSKHDEINKDKIREILKTRTRFHNNKANYLLEAKQMWSKIKPTLEKRDIITLRNWLSENVKGYGLKEASHFIRNIGKSNSKIAILDRHILRNLKSLDVIKDEKIKNRGDYLEKEQKFIEFAKKMQIPIDELDLLFWSEENGEIFK